MSEREWRGKAVSVGHFPGQSRWPTKIEVTEEAARKLALSLARLKQTTFALPDEVQEVLSALNYVFVSDPQSMKEHQRMEAGKGMTPDGGFRKGIPGPA